MLRRGCLFALLGIFAALGIIGGGVDIAARHYATSRIESRIRASVPEAQGVHAHILGWPFLKVGVTGHVDEIGARISRVVERGLVFSNVGVDLHGVKIKTGPLFNGKVVVESIQRGTFTASVLASDLGAVLGTPVTIVGNAFSAHGATVNFSVDMGNRRLVITVAGIPTQTLPLPGVNLLPCAPAVTFAHQAVTLSCTFDHVPTALTNVA
jgi:hypothetical protein